MVDSQPATRDPSPAMQDYLKHIYSLEQEEIRAGRVAGVTTSALAESLGVSAASATNMLKKLAALNFITYAPYRGAELSEGGRKVALEVIRHHRLLETYLAEVLGVPWDEVHDEAEVLEHFLSERLEERMAKLLGDPTHDPHGHPIPAPSLAEPISAGERLSDLAEGDSAVIAEVSDRDPGLLRFLAEQGLTPGTVVTATEIAPYTGAMTLQVAGRSMSIGRDAAGMVLVGGRS